MATKLSVVIPVFNSARVLPVLVERISAAVAPLVGVSFEIVLVNDASSDDSWKVIQALGRSMPAVKGLSLRRNAGQHNALMAGLNYASGGVVVVMDDDLQHAPEDISLLYSKVIDGYDVCFARFLQLRHAWWKRLGGKFNDFIARILLKKPRDIYLSPFKAFSGSIRGEVIRYTGPFAYLDGLILMNTASMTCVDVRHHDRLEGHSNYTFAKSISLWTKMATSFSVLPLRIAGFVGLGISLCGFCLAALAIVLKIFGRIEIPIGWTSLIVVVLVIGGVQLFALGMIGEYLGRAYVHLNNVPQFSVKETINV